MLSVRQILVDPRSATPTSPVLHAGEAEPALATPNGHVADQRPPLRQKLIDMIAAREAQRKTQRRN